MKKLQTVSLLDVLPESILLDPKLKASAEALDVQLQAVTAATREVLHLPRLDELSGAVVDYLAEQFHLDFYEPLYLTEDEKKNLIRESIAWHRIKGTTAAVERIAQDVFRSAEVIEWFDYDGKPYHFKIRSHGFKQTPDGWLTYIRMLNAAKNVRSWCDNYELYLNEDDFGVAQVFAGNAEVEAGGATFSLARPKTDYAAKVFAGNVDLIHGNATESLRKPNSDFETLIRAGVALKKSGVIRIGSKTQPSTDESHFARSWTSKSFAGTVLDVRGRQFWNLKLPTKEFVQTFATTAQLQTGRISIDTRREQNLAHEIKLHAATILNRSGAITIGSQTQPTADENYFTQSFKSKITTSTATLRTGRLTFGDETTRHKRKTVVRVGCVQKVTGYVTIGCNDIQEWPPLPEFGNWLTLRFRFATNPSKRFVTLKNPREDLVKDDIREVSKFSAATGILLNTQKSPTTGIDLAMIKRRSERKIL